MGQNGNSCECLGLMRKLYVLLPSLSFLIRYGSVKAIHIIMGIITFFKCFLINITSIAFFFKIFFSFLFIRKLMGIIDLTESAELMS